MRNKQTHKKNLKSYNILLQKERNVIFINSVIAYLEIPRNYTKNLLEFIRKFNRAIYT